VKYWHYTNADPYIIVRLNAWQESFRTWIYDYISCLAPCIAVAVIN